MTSNFDFNTSNKSQRFGSFRAVVFFLLLLATVSGCKDDELIGLEVQPDGDQLGLLTVDTLTITTNTVREDSLRSDEASFNLIGRYNDPIFGSSQAHVYTHFRLSADNIDFGDIASITVDSVVLSMVYLNAYGVEADQQTFNVYELDEQIYRDSAYLGDSEVAFNPLPIGSAIVSPNTTDSVLVNGVSEPSQLRIPLDVTIGQRLIDGSVADYSDNSSFQSFFKGVYISPDSSAPQASGEGAILGVNLLSTFSRLTIYYKDANGDAQDFEYLVNDSCARVNRFQHNYTGTEVQQQLDDPTLGQQKIYIQSMSGVKSDLKIPSLQTIAGDQKVVVNRAQLIFHLNETDFGNYDPPNNLFVVALDASGDELFIPDQFETGTHYGGVYDEINRRYRFNITRHVQNLIDQHQAGVNDNYGMRLIAGGSVVSATRVALNGATAANKKITLIVSYTPIN